MQDPKIRAELREMLQEDYHITENNDLRAVIQFLNDGEIPVDAILLASEDAAVVELICMLRDNAKFAMTALLLVTGQNLTDKELSLLEMGAVDCLQMPFQQKLVMHRVENAIRFKDSVTYEEMESILRALPSNIYMKNVQGRYIFCTHYWHHLHHADEPDWTIRGKTDVEIRKDKENAEAALQADLDLLKSGKSSQYTIEINSDGIQEFFEIIKHPICNQHGIITGIVGLINNVTEYEQMKRVLEKQLHTDEMTGLYSRSYFEEFLRKIQKEEHKGDFPVCIISADCDGLKSVNDVYGHLAGDQYIRMAAMLFRMILPDKSYVFRTGGDEFIILLPKSDQRSGNHYIQQMCEQAGLFQIKDHKLSISFGLAMWADRSTPATVCLAESDKNMYAEKKRKKDVQTLEFPFLIQTRHKGRLVLL